MSHKIDFKKIKDKIHNTIPPNVQNLLNRARSNCQEVRIIVEGEDDTIDQPVDKTTITITFNQEGLYVRHFQGPEKHHH